MMPDIPIAAGSDGLGRKALQFLAAADSDGSLQVIGSWFKPRTAWGVGGTRPKLLARETDWRAATDAAPEEGVTGRFVQNRTLSLTGTVRGDDA
jgi:hypothetical protein